MKRTARPRFDHLADGLGELVAPQRLRPSDQPRRPRHAAGVDPQSPRLRLVASGRFADSPWSRPFPPRTSQRLAPRCSPASTVLWPRPTSSLRSSQASDTSFPARPRFDHRGRVKTSQVPVVGLHACMGSSTPRSSPAPCHIAVWGMLPSTCLTVSALRTISFSALNIPARMHRYRRFTPGLTADDARLAEKRGWLLLSFRGTFTRYPSTSLSGTPRIRLCRGGVG